MDQADVNRLRHIRDAAAEVLRFAAGKIRADLDHDRMLVLAILRDLEVIGEAASRVSLAARQSSLTIPWDDMIGMRNRLVHGYFDVNLDTVWGPFRTICPVSSPTSTRRLARHNLPEYEELEDPEDDPSGVTIGVNPLGQRRACDESEGGDRFFISTG